MADQQIGGATKAAPIGQPLFTTPIWGKAEVPAATAASSHASLAVLATTTLDPKTMPMLKQMHKGDHVVLPFAADNQIEGEVNLVVPNASGWVQVAGHFTGGEMGDFTLSQSVADSNVWAGQILRNDVHLGYQVTTTTDGRVKMDRKPLDSMICESLPAAAAGDVAAAAPDTSAPDAAAPADASGDAAAIPVLSSKPYTVGIGVLYLDFDGETVTDASWNGGVTIFAAPATINGAAITAAQITDVFNRVAED
ncbi:MAG: hypothetical protein JWO94_804, partial [Verrucomicrobiaceae bacterium]|nr:hypothetical protein [Verrucomicrobiaceae bacterium]